MSKSLWVRGAASVLALLVLVGSVPAAEAAAATTKIAVKGMHCPACAKKVTGKVKAVSGVAEATADVKASEIKVTPKKDQTLSPRALWEAVEKAGYKPTKLAGPSGTFTEKPKS